MIKNIVLLIWVMQTNGGLTTDDEASTSENPKHSADEIERMYSFINKE